MSQLWQQIVTGQAKNITLLVGALVLFAYFLLTVAAFARGHRRFWPILICNILLHFGPESDFSCALSRLFHCDHQ